VLPDLSPDITAIVWGTKKDPSRGPKRGLSIKKIVDTAVDIADREGLHSVTMASVAESLGYSAMSLYRYTPSKEALLMLMLEAVCGIPLPDEGGKWREGMRQFVDVYVDILKKHPWCSEIPFQMALLTPSVLRIVDYQLRLMREFPMSGMMKMGLIHLIREYTRSYIDQMLLLNKGSRTENSIRSFYGEYAETLQTLVTPDRFPDLHLIITSECHSDGVENELKSNFDFGLNLIFDGIEKYLGGRT